MIHARGLARSFTTKKGREKTEVKAVDGVDIDVEDGEIVGFLGPNGAGKTTTLRMLTTLLRRPPAPPRSPATTSPTQAEQVRRSIGYVAQCGSTLPEARAGEEVVDHGRLYGISQGAGRRSAARSCSTSSTSTGCGPGKPRRHVRRPAPPARHRDGPRPRPEAGVPRRADHRPRPAGAGQPLGPHRRLRAERGHDGLPHHPLPGRGRRALRPHPGHRPRRDRRERHPRGLKRRSPATWSSSC